MVPPDGRAEQPIAADGVGALPAGTGAGTGIPLAGGFDRLQGAPSSEVQAIPAEDQPKSAADLVVGEGLSRGMSAGLSQGAIARPLQALISTVARVGIRPHPGFMLGPEPPGLGEVLRPATSAPTQPPDFSSGTGLTAAEGLQSPANGAAHQESGENAPKVEPWQDCDPALSLRGNGLDTQATAEAKPTPLAAAMEIAPAEGLQKTGKRAQALTLAQQAAPGAKRVRRSSAVLRNAGKPLLAKIRSSLPAPQDVSECRQAHSQFPWVDLV